MATTAERLDYYYVLVPNKAGEATRILAELSKAGVNLRGFSGFPNGRKSQLDFFPDDGKAFLKVLKGLGIPVSGRKTGFRLAGSDDAGALGEVMGRLSAAGVNVISAQVVGGGSNQYAGLVWVDPKNMRAATKALGAQ